MSEQNEWSEESIESLSEEELVEAFEDFVGTIVGQVWNGGSYHGLAKGDLRSYGFKGLIEAFRNYDPDRETAFTTYAFRRVKGAMLDAMREFRRAPRGRTTRERDNVGPRRANRTSRSFRESAEEVSLHGETASDPKDAAICTYLMAPTDMESLEFGCDGGQEESVADRDLLEALREAMEQLSEFERTIIRLYDIEGCTMTDIAEEMGCSKGWAARIRDRAHGEMREYFADRYGEETAGALPFDRAG